MNQPSRTDIVMVSRLTCPVCQHSKEEIMPSNACTFFYKCENCGSTLTPKEGDCCVFCSYGDVDCPPVQENGKGSCCS